MPIAASKNQLDPKDPSLIVRLATEAEAISICKEVAAAWVRTIRPLCSLGEYPWDIIGPPAPVEGVKTWVLAKASVAPGEWPILCSLETFFRHSLTSDFNGNVKDNVIPVMASFHCPDYQLGSGYMTRLTRDVVQALRRCQIAGFPFVGIQSYFDVGRTYYAKSSWLPNSTTTRIELPAEGEEWPDCVQMIGKEGLETLLLEDHIAVRSHMGIPTKEAETRLTLLLDRKQVEWYKRREDFVCMLLYGRAPAVWGAITGLPGNRVWAIWTHRYNGREGAHTGNNVLYILRLVMQADTTATRLHSDAAKRPLGGIQEDLINSLTAVLQAAQFEAQRWNLDAVELWDPTPLTTRLLAISGLAYRTFDGKNEHIAPEVWLKSNGKGYGTKPPRWARQNHHANIIEEHEVSRWDWSFLDC